MSDEHFTVDGTLIEAYGSLKSLRRQDDTQPPSPPDDPGNPTVDFRGEKRSNETHASTSDPDARLARKVARAVGGTPNVRGTTHPACAPMGCAASGANGGAIGDGGGAAINCGTCTATQPCGGGGTPYVCGSLHRSARSAEQTALRPNERWPFRTGSRAQSAAEVAGRTARALDRRTLGVAIRDDGADLAHGSATSAIVVRAVRRLAVRYPHSR